MKIAIIGAGAAGLMAAATILEAKRADIKLTIFEKNPIIGRKVIISGGGRCNVTTSITEVSELLKNYPRGARFLRYAFHEFGPKEIYQWFEDHKVALKTEPDLRVFPQSNDGKDIVGVFTRLFKKAEVDLRLKSQVKEIKKYKNNFLVTTDKEESFDKIIIATGGQAYRHTGSTGDGYTFAESLGHTVSELAPSLNSFISLETWPAKIPGTVFQKALISSDRNKKFKYQGPFLFTHKGISGPAVFALSSMVAFEKYQKNNPLNIFIDLFVDLNFEQLRDKFSKYLNGNTKSLVKALAHFELTKKSAAMFLEILNIDGEKKAAEVNKKEINKICNFLKAIPLQIVGRGAGDEFVTAGGINLKEIDQKTMQSKLCPGAYFVGEVLNVDGFTGGFNLSASWAAGFVAGKDVVEDS